MTNHELKSIRKGLNLTQREIAFWINPHAKHMGREIRRWETGENTIPGYIETLLKMFDDGAKPVHIK